MKPKCLACGEELTEENVHDDWGNFCISCAEVCTALELLSMETDSKRLG